MREEDGKKENPDGKRLECEEGEHAYRGNRDENVEKE